MTTVAVVPLSDRSFQKLTSEKKYVFPKGRLRKIDCLYVYRVAPISAITHRVELCSDTHGPDPDVSLAEKLQTFTDPSKDAWSVKIQDITALTEPIPRLSGQPTLQSGMYVDIEQVRTAKSLADLYSKRKNRKPHQK